MATPFSIENIGSMCPPCQSAFTDDGRLIWVTVGWLVLLSMLWPYARLAKAAPMQRPTWKKLGIFIFAASISAVIVTSIAFWSDRPGSISSSFGAFLSFISGGRSAAACLGCADLEPVVYGLVAWTEIPIYLMSFLALLFMRRKLSKISDSGEPQVRKPLWFLTVFQGLMLAPYLLVLFLQASAS